MRTKTTRFLTTLLILLFTWAGFIWLTQAPPVEAVPALLMVWATAIFLLLAFFPSILSNVGKFKIGDMEFELRYSVRSASTQPFLSVSDLGSAFELTNQGNAGGLQAILARTLEAPGKPVLLVIDVQEQKITRAFLFAFLLLVDLLSERVVVVFAALGGAKRPLESLNVAEIMGVISGKKLLLAYYRRFPSLMNIFVRESAVQSALESSGLVQTPSSELILALYDQCKSQIAHDIQQEKGRYGDLDGDEMERSFTRKEVETWLGELLNRRVVNLALQPADISTLRQALEAKGDYVIIADKGGIKATLSLDDVSRVIAHKALAPLTD